MNIFSRQQGTCRSYNIHYLLFIIFDKHLKYNFLGSGVKMYFVFGILRVGYTYIFESKIAVILVLFSFFFNLWLFFIWLSIIYKMRGKIPALLMNFNGQRHLEVVFGLLRVNFAIWELFFDSWESIEGILKLIFWPVWVTVGPLKVNFEPLEIWFWLIGRRILALVVKLYASGSQF